MKGVTQRWIAAQCAAVSLVLTAGVASAADVTDTDRVYRNYTRETATVPEDQVRLEVRGLHEQDDGHTRLDLLGFPVKSTFPGKTATSVSGGVIDLLGSYGFAKNAEVGFLIPGFIESMRFTDGTHANNEDIGDVMMYTKFQRPVAQHCSVGAGFELSVPTGTTGKGFGTGELGFNPVVSSRYQRGPFAIGANVGYQMYTGDTPNAKDVFNYGAEVIVRGSETYAFRTEIAGRTFNQRGTRFHDLTILPGIDFNVAPNFTIRPTGMAGGTDTALDWGIGLGLAFTFAAPQAAMAAPPPPAAAPAPPPPPPPTKEKIILRGVNFDFDKAVIRSDARPILDQAVETLKEHGAIAITVEGHTDSVGTDEYNQRLSVRRATAVRDYLGGHGIDASRMSVVGQGESKPVASNKTSDGRAQNRRVELLVTP
jgi:outer membrane protein OmpA-like peptidoglycan-associated protein